MCIHNYNIHELCSNVVEGGTHTHTLAHASSCPQKRGTEQKQRNSDAAMAGIAKTTQLTKNKIGIATEQKIYS